MHFAEAYSEPCHTSKIERFAKIVKCSSLNIWHVWEAATDGILQKKLFKNTCFEEHLRTAALDVSEYASVLHFRIWNVADVNQVFTH